MANQRDHSGLNGGPWDAVIVTTSVGEIARQRVSVTAIDPISGNFTEVGDSTNNAVRVNVVAGTVSIGGTVTVSGTVTANQGGAWTVAATQSGTWTVQAAQSGSWTVAATQSGTWNVGITGQPISVAQSGAWTVAATQSGTWTVQQGGAPWSFNLTQVGGVAIALGQTTMASSIPVVIASNQSAIPVSISGSVPVSFTTPFPVTIQDTQGNPLDAADVTTLLREILIELRAHRFILNSYYEVDLDQWYDEARESTDQGLGAT